MNNSNIKIQDLGDKYFVQFNLHKAENDLKRSHDLKEALDSYRDFLKLLKESPHLGPDDLLLFQEQLSTGYKTLSSEMEIVLAIFSEIKKLRNGSKK